MEPKRLTFLFLRKEFQQVLLQVWDKVFDEATWHEHVQNHHLKLSEIELDEVDCDNHHKA